MRDRDEERVQTLHPDPKKSGPRILRWKYEAVRRAILNILPTAEPGLPFRELTGGVRDRLSGEELGALGSASWYVVTVKLDLEARGEVSRLPGGGPQRLIRID
jgi:hypothetical protein